MRTDTRLSWGFFWVLVSSVFSSSAARGRLGPRFCCSTAPTAIPPLLFIHTSPSSFCACDHWNACFRCSVLLTQFFLVLLVTDMTFGWARMLFLILMYLTVATISNAYPCRYNCSNVNNIYCKTKETVCGYPNGDDLAMERANMLLAKSTKKKCTRAMKLFICHLWFPTCQKEGSVGNVNPVTFFLLLCLNLLSSALLPPCHVSSKIVT